MFACQNSGDAFCKIAWPHAVLTEHFTSSEYLYQSSTQYLELSHGLVNNRYDMQWPWWHWKHRDSCANIVQTTMTLDWGESVVYAHRTRQPFTSFYGCFFTQASCKWQQNVLLCSVVGNVSIFVSMLQYEKCVHSHFLSRNSIINCSRWCRTLHFL